MRFHGARVAFAVVVVFLCAGTPFSLRRIGFFALCRRLPSPRDALDRVCSDCTISSLDGKAGATVVHPFRVVLAWRALIVRFFKWTRGVSAAFLPRSSRVHEKFDNMAQ